MTECGERRSGHGCLWAIIIAQGVVLLGIFALVAGLVVLGAAVSGRRAGQSLGADEYPDLNEVWAWGRGKAKVVQIPLRGMIMLGEEEGMFSRSFGNADGCLAAIRRAANDPDVRALILDIDSGGGGITACDVIHQELLAFKASSPGRRVVSILGDVAASGGYYVAAPSDAIIAHPTTLTGSIGVLLQSVNLRGLAEKLGIRDETIKSGPDKDLLNPLHDLTAGQRQMLQDVVNELHERFVGIVASGRGLREEDVRKIADGRVFTGRRALELGLVDEVGHWDRALSKTAELLGEQDIKVYRYERAFSWAGLFMARSGTPSLEGLLRPLTSTRLLYYWQP
jgi:protease-4